MPAKCLALLIISCTLVMVCTSCKRMKCIHSVVSAMQTYDRYILHMDTDSIALMYTIDGDLGDKAHGRDSIRKFLASFKNVRVLSQLSKTTSINIRDDSLLQKGTYVQVAIVGEKDTVHVQGGYRVDWRWFPEEGWKIKRMDTKPGK